MKEMKKKIFNVLIAILALGLLSSCSEGNLDDESIIVESQTKETQFDKWLTENLVNPYNIQWMYRYVDFETDMNYYQVPADFEQAVKLAHIVKYACIEAYDEVAGINFTRQYFPKLFTLSGEWLYRNNGTIVLGMAEGGKKIFLAGVNYLNQNLSSRASLNRLYLKTIHHEFTHILNQTKDYSADFQLITGSDYVADSWNEEPYNQSSYYLTHGFVSSYAQNSHGEDFAESMSVYLTTTPEDWDSMIASAGDGAALINQKMEIVRNYMSESWGIDITELRGAIINRENDIINGTIDLTDISTEN